MRSREEITGQRDLAGHHDNEEQFELILEVLLDIRDLLQSLRSPIVAMEHSPRHKIRYRK